MTEFTYIISGGPKDGEEGIFKGRIIPTMDGTLRAGAEVIILAHKYLCIDVSKEGKATLKW